MSEILQPSPEIARAIFKETEDGLPEEKARARLQMVETAKALRATGSLRTKEGLGQRVASIPGRVYFRWDQEFPGCWRNQEFVDAWLADNPAFCDPGYFPKQHALRHGKSFIGGKPV